MNSVRDALHPVEAVTLRRLVADDVLDLRRNPTMKPRRLARIARRAADQNRIGARWGACTAFRAGSSKGRTAAWARAHWECACCGSGPRVSLSCWTSGNSRLGTGRASRSPGSAARSKYHALPLMGTYTTLASPWMKPRQRPANQQLTAAPGHRGPGPRTGRRPAHRRGPPPRWARRAGPTRWGRYRAPTRWPRLRRWRRRARRARAAPAVPLHRSYCRAGAHPMAPKPSP